MHARGDGRGRGGPRGPEPLTQAAALTLASPAQTPFPIETSGHASTNNHQANALVVLAGPVLLSVEGYNKDRALGELKMAVGGVLLIGAWFRMNRRG